MEELKKIYRKLRALGTKVRNGLFGHKNYRKFVIISRSRTGSTLLMALLRSHPNVHIEGELFKKLNGESCRTVWDRLFRKHPKSIQQVGFKLFYYHPFDADQSVWEFLLNDKDISVIHLRRLNLLRAFASQKIGEKTKKWTQHKSDSTTHDKTIALDIAECKETFEKISAYEERTRKQFQDHHTYVEVTYENLAKDNQKVINELFDKLGLPEFNASTVLKKQNPEPLERLIENFDDLKDAFKNTNWEYLLTENDI